MSIVVFILVLAVLIVVHELGHFFAAKMSGVRVDEFGIGFPPRALSFKPKKGETRYSLNWIPLGGFVKIFGEEVSEDSATGPDSKRSFINKPSRTQIWILVAGVLGNVLAAWLFLSVGFMIGLPASVETYDSKFVSDSHVEVTTVLPDSPAQLAGLSAGDKILAFSRGEEEKEIVSTSDVNEFIGSNTNSIEITVERQGVVEQVSVSPAMGIIENSAALGIGIDKIGIVSLPPHIAVWEGGRVSIKLLGAIAVGLWNLIGDAVTGSADLSQLTGPVGLVGLVGEAGALGFRYLLSFTAFISLNLAIINLIPFPALDGGRIVFVLIEKLKGSPIRPRVANTLNTIGFALLILLMLVVTYNDIINVVNK